LPDVDSSTSEDPEDTLPKVTMMRKPTVDLKKKKEESQGFMGRKLTQ